jgi:hypothetical protein
MTKFYKSAHEDVFNAYKSYKSLLETVKEDLDKFAGIFDGKAVLSYDLHGHRFAGLNLNDFISRADRELWTKPVSHKGNISRPRASVKNKDIRKDLKDLKDKFNSNIPEVTKADLEPLLTSIGTDWGNLVFSGFGLHEKDGVIYVVTGAELNKSMVEILGSEYEESKINCNY